MQRAPVIHRALQTRFSDGRLEYRFLNLGGGLIDARARVEIDVVDAATIVSERRIRKTEVDCIRPTGRGSVWVFRLNRRLEIACFAGDLVPRVAVVNDAVLHFDIRG